MNASIPHRVLHRCGTWLAATENWIYNQVRYANGKFEQHVACLDAENVDRFPWPRLHVFPKKSVLGKLRRSGLPGLRGRATELPWLWRCIKQVRPAIVHSHFADFAYGAADLIARQGVRHVVTFYGYDVNRLPRVHPEWKQKYLKLFQQADLFLCEGPHMAKCVVALGCPPDKVKVQRLGVEVEKIKFVPRQWTPGTPFRVLIATSFREKKGIPYALQALRKVADRLPLELTIIGDATAHEKDQREKAKILQVLAETGLGKRARLMGYQPHSVLWEEALRHHLFLQPSITASDGDTEGGAPVTVIEMAASGIPIVSSRHCDIPGVILDGETGLLADERDVDGLAAHIIKLVEQPEQWMRMLTAGRRHIERHFDCEIQGRQLSEYYELLLNGRAHTAAARQTAGNLTPAEL